MRGDPEAVSLHNDGRVTKLIFTLVFRSCSCCSNMLPSMVFSCDRKGKQEGRM